MAGSGAIAYSAKLQSRVVPSSKDAEFNAAYSITRSHTEKKTKGAHFSPPIL